MLLVRVLNRDAKLAKGLANFIVVKCRLRGHQVLCSMTPEQPTAASAGRTSQAMVLGESSKMLV